MRDDNVVIANEKFLSLADPPRHLAEIFLITSFQGASGEHVLKRYLRPYAGHFHSGISHSKAAKEDY